MSRSARAPRARGQWKKRLVDVSPLLLLLLGRASLADHYHVPSGSMEPTLQVEDRLVVDKRAYGLRVPLTHLWLTQNEPRRGDVVVFDSPVDGRVMVKRLVGLPGDRVAFDGAFVLLNGERVPQALGPDGSRVEFLPGALHPLHPEPDQGPALSEVRVPPRHYLVLGDHRGNSADSRSWGFVPRDHLLGRALAVLYSPREGLSPGERWWLPLGPPPADSGLDPRLTR